MGEEDSITLGKDALYGTVMVLLAGLLVVSMFTQGFGIMATECPVPEDTPECPDTVQQANDSENTTEPALPELTVEFGDYPPLGDENAPVAMVEFSEFQCPFCQKLYLQAESQLKSNYIDAGKLKLYFRDYPLPPEYHPQAGIAAIAARCANDEGKFWEMHHKLFDTRDSWSGSSDADSLFKGYAEELGLDNETFNSCYDNQLHVGEIAADLSAGQSYGVGGTPSSFLIIPKDKISEEDIKAVVLSLNEEYGGLGLAENDNEYTVFIPGAYPYEAFDAVLSAVDY